MSLTVLQTKAENQFRLARNRVDFLKSVWVEEVYNELTPQQQSDFAKLTTTVEMRAFLRGIPLLPLEDRPVQYLRVLASRRGIKNYSLLPKEELISRINAYDRSKR